MPEPFGLYNYWTIMRILSFFLAISTALAYQRNADYTEMLIKLNSCLTGKAFKNPKPYQIGRSVGSSGSKSILLNQQIIQCQKLVAKLRRLAMCKRAGFKNC